jgi:starvation-inducible DNA-binding protein
MFAAKQNNMQPTIGFNEEVMSNVAHQLLPIVADEFLLFLKTRNAHWNVEGIDFHAKHLFFEEQFNQLDDLMDMVAERIRMLGHYAPGTVNELMQLTHLTEQSRLTNDSIGFIKELLQDHQVIIIYLRGLMKDIALTVEDVGTGDFITSLIETHEKMAWMLRAHLGR